MKVRVVLSIEVDADAWRDEYGDPSFTAADIREAIRAAVQSAASTPGIVVPEGIIQSVEDMS